MVLATVVAISYITVLVVAPSSTANSASIIDNSEDISLLYQKSDTLQKTFHDTFVEYQLQHRRYCDRGMKDVLEETQIIKKELGHFMVNILLELRRDIRELEKSITDLESHLELSTTLSLEIPGLRADLHEMIQKSASLEANLVEHAELITVLRGVIVALESS